jgi:hypothetical protein
VVLKRLVYQITESMAKLKNGRRRERGRWGDASLGL